MTAKRLFALGWRDHKGKWREVKTDHFSVDWDFERMEEVGGDMDANAINLFKKEDA